jgi:hypothetical protein
MATPARFSPNNNCPTNDGTINNLNPVIPSPTAAIVSTGLFISKGRNALNHPKRQ